MENVPTTLYRAGEVIFREGDPSNSVYLIVSGKVKITKSSKEGDILLATQGKDTIFGEMNVIDGKTRSATVTAIEDTFCYKCNGSGLFREIAQLPRDLRVVLQSLSSIIREHNKQLVSSNKKFSADVILDETDEKFDPLMTEEEILSDIVQNEIKQVQNPFLKGLFRVLMATAFKN